MSAGCSIVSGSSSTSGRGLKDDCTHGRGIHIVTFFNAWNYSKKESIKTVVF